MKRLIISTAILTAVLLPITVLAQSYRYNYTLVNNVAPTSWEKTDTQYGPWENVGEPYGCSNWSPSTSTIGKGISFTQSATDCNQDQSRWAIDYEINTANGDIRPVGELYLENRIESSSSERDAVGTLENWVAYTPTYTNWLDTNSLYNCSSWAPNPAFFVFEESSSFTQTSDNCSTDQQRQRQDREQERFTEEIRNNGEPVTEHQTLNAQSASRTYSVTLGEWTSSGEPYGCTNWSPDASTVNNGQTFTQTATDCKQDQARKRSDSYVDHKTGSTVGVPASDESRTLSEQTNSREATGTKVDYVYDANTYQVSCKVVGFSGPPANQMMYLTEAYWNGTRVLNIGSLGSCSDGYPVGKTFTGSDGKSYTVGPVTSSPYRSLRQN